MCCQHPRRRSCAVGAHSGGIHACTCARRARFVFSHVQRPQRYVWMCCPPLSKFDAAVFVHGCSQGAHRVRFVFGHAVKAHSGTLVFQIPPKALVIKSSNARASCACFVAHEFLRTTYLLLRAEEMCCVTMNLPLPYSPVGQDLLFNLPHCLLRTTSMLTKHYYGDALRAILKLYLIHSYFNATTVISTTFSFSESCL